MTEQSNGGETLIRVHLTDTCGADHVGHGPTIRAARLAAFLRLRDRCASPRVKAHRFAVHLGDGSGWRLLGPKV